MRPPRSTAFTNASRSTIQTLTVPGQSRSTSTSATHARAATRRATAAGETEDMGDPDLTPDTASTSAPGPPSSPDSTSTPS